MVMESKGNWRLVSLVQDRIAQGQGFSDAMNMVIEEQCDSRERGKRADEVLAIFKQLARGENSPRVHPPQPVEQFLLFPPKRQERKKHIS